MTSAHLQALLTQPLYVNGLFKVQTPTLVARYNRTLAALGLKETTLKAFHLDMMGFSPEIAAETGDPFYLSYGTANPFVVVVSPLQAGKMLLNPYHSFDALLTQQFYSVHARQLGDLTRDTCVYAELDQGLSHYASASDLLLIHRACLQPSAGELSAVIDQQNALVSQFMQDGNRWFDRRLRHEIIRHARQHGDLRERAHLLSSVCLEPVASFYTQAFGGVFVLRGQGGSYLVFERVPETRVHSAEAAVLTLSHPELPEQLMGENLADIDLDYYAVHTEKLRELLDYLLATILCDADPTVQFSLLSATQRRQRLFALRHQTPPVYFELEQLISRLEAGMTVTHASLSRDLFRLLLHPHRDLDELSRITVWQLLLRLAPIHPKRLFKLDKRLFFQQFASWTPARQRWVTEVLAAP
jgi:hypothetical protein